ncbi:unnamed protein product [Echinostoma caproni]|uniref:WD_REPEATS_REGION domain-containing protein n=1 Tax=Echinostoma caproni TaxID=27848 RepID=A0A183AES4_9TREM|nr:unnamed protein product [Echinostoma caproni]
MSNIRCLTLPCKLSSNTEIETETNYLLTGGGRGQVCLWSLGLDSGQTTAVADPAVWRPGWLGFTRLRHTETDGLSSLAGHISRSATTRHADPRATDLRVMALVCLRRVDCPHTNWLLGMAACSDGSIR